MNNIVEGEWNLELVVRCIIILFILLSLGIFGMKLYLAWPTLAIKATEICIGGGCL